MYYATHNSHLHVHRLKAMQAHDMSNVMNSTNSSFMKADFRHPFSSSYVVLQTRLQYIHVQFLGKVKSFVG